MRSQFGLIHGIIECLPELSQFRNCFLSQTENFQKKQSEAIGIRLDLVERVFYIWGLPK